MKLLKTIKVDYTFPTRLLSFVKDIKANCAMGQEEKEYIERVARIMREQQKADAIEEWEINYLNRTEKS